MLCAGLLALLLSACASNPGKNFEMPAGTIYSRLKSLDLGTRIDSATYMFDKQTTTIGEGGKTVFWRLKGQNILVAHLEASGENATNVKLEMPLVSGSFMRGIGYQLMEERVAAHLERRPFDDKKIMDAMYAGSMVPAGIQAQAFEAQREFARVGREMGDYEDTRWRGSNRDDPYEARRQMKSASAPTTDLSRYENR